MRVLFFGNSFNSLPPLRRLAQGRHRIVGVVSPTGSLPQARGRRLKTALRNSLVAQMSRLPLSDAHVDRLGRLDLALARFAHAYGTQLLRPATINSPETIDALARLAPDVVVMVGFNQILKAPLLDRLPTVLNVHPSLLPEFRGPAPFFWVLAHGLSHSGVTVHEVSTGIDTGPIVAQRAFDVPPWFTSGHLRARCGEVAGELLLQVLDAFADAPRRPQTAAGSYYGVIKPEHLIAPLTQGAWAVYNRARAAAPDRPLRLFVPKTAWPPRPLSPLPVSTTPAPDQLELQLGRALAPIGSRGAPSGTASQSAHGLLVHCDDGSVLFRDVSPKAAA